MYNDFILGGLSQRPESFELLPQQTTQLKLLSVTSDLCLRPWPSAIGFVQPGVTGLTLLDEALPTLPACTQEEAEASPFSYTVDSVTPEQVECKAH